ncbi:16S rRNA (uracil(1498)-N(3))-methyltransferase [Faecalicatena contorta]|uniref:Ribosomal RNA small subunit methyltransferase E n=1 Tax=Faecalicatena contorta TaxID=39482 RepID=A0A316AD31_9FIRM|nr:16S rRNA (uracil(1498)-N(3))-methyltransferase [Faecalicatena contorta]PWJ47677.1 16S rRNA (uracil1498-N3)-methyltransferase [Faecalicatena contorta]SUQ15870.1 16S rRNA (uracil1498-N3)-methyltransferase [Faecalicatena contorta]
MHHFFAEPSQIKGGIVCIEGTDVNHMKNVLRMKAGEKVEVSDGQGTEYLCEVDRYEEEYAFLRIISAGRKEAELPSKIFLFQGLPKGDKMELIIQKAVELGVYQIIPTSTKRAVVKLDAKKAGKKTERWNAIALSAAKQSGRSRVPQVMPVLSFREALEQARELDVVMIPYEQAEGMEKTREIISAVRPGQDVGIFIGPEGGFEEDEVEKAIQSGAHSITLGKRILRTETAGLAILSILMYHLENS